MTDPIPAAERLAGLLTRENAALAALDLATVAALVADKRAAIDGLVGQGDAVRRMPPALAERLRGLARENQALLRRALEVQGRVIALVAGAGAEVACTARYGAGGRMAAARVVPRALLARV